MQVLDDHWLDAARRCPSPNCDDRPRQEISLVVLHSISLPPGQFGSGLVEALFCNTLDCDRDPVLADLAGVEVSAHLLIDRGGEITQFVPFDRRAWHAGRSNWRGREGCNDYSIGIELEGADGLPYEAPQYHALNEVCAALLARYRRLTAGAIVGHMEVAPGRKTDPSGSFDWQRFFALLSTTLGRDVAHRH